MGWIKRFMPKSLLGRSLLMILIQLVALQAVTFQMFYGSHLDIESRRLTAAIAGEVALTTELMDRFPGQPNHDWIIARARRRLGLEITLERKDKPNIQTVAFPNTYSDDKNPHPLTPPELGEHNAEYLKPLGYSDQQIAEFKEKGII